MQIIKSLRVQTLYLPPPKPTLTAATLPPRTGKVIIITGATSGQGFGIARVLYKSGATVYIGARNESRAKAKATIKTITASASSTTPAAPAGKLHFLPRPRRPPHNQAFVQSFLSRKSRLGILFNNAGVASIPVSNRVAQNLELRLGTNCAGQYLLTQLLSPILVSTVQNPSAAPNTVRVVWSSSMLVDALGHVRVSGRPI